MSVSSGVSANTLCPSPYIGRFAPSPSGPLHHGSLLTALASYLDAKAAGGQWLLRIEDVDQHRTVKGAEDQIIKSLTAHGLHWDGKIHRQSNRKQRYQQVLELLANNDQIFYCNCQRKHLRTQGARYLGHCRSQRNAAYTEATPHTPASHAIRFDISHTSPAEISFNDKIQGLINFDLTKLGDFIIKRRDSLFAYQLAVVVDDIDQGVTTIVRGSDLLASTPWQIALIQALGGQIPRYAHLPLLIDPINQHKLSKQTAAKAIYDHCASNNLITALSQLGQKIPENANNLTTTELLAYAVKQWNIQTIPKQNISF